MLRSWFFLLQVYNHLNPYREPIKLVSVEKNDLFFGQVMSIDDVIISTLKNESQYIMITPYFSGHNAHTNFDMFPC
jgi:hypothetical protein